MMGAAGAIGVLSTGVETAPAQPCAPQVRAGTGLILLWLAALLAIGISHAADADLRLVHPALLLPACGSLLWPARTSPGRQIQTVVFLSLMWMVVAACVETVWTIGGPGGSCVHVSRTVAVVVMIGLGQLLHRRRGAVRGALGPFAGSALACAIGVVLVHTVVLVLLLSGFYAFGLEDDRAVLGRLGLCAIVLVGLEPVAGSFALRASLALTLAGVLLARSLP